MILRVITDLIALVNDLKNLDSSIEHIGLDIPSLGLPRGRRTMIRERFRILVGRLGAEIYLLH